MKRKDAPPSSGARDGHGQPSTAKRAKHNHHFGPPPTPPTPPPTRGPTSSETYKLHVLSDKTLLKLCLEFILHDTPDSAKTKVPQPAFPLGSVKRYRKHLPPEEQMDAYECIEQNSPEWQTLRKTLGTFGSSGVGEFCGWDEWSTNFLLWLREMGIQGPPERSAWDCRFFDHGHYWEHDTGHMLPLLMGCRAWAVGLFVDRQYPSNHTSPDLLVEYEPGVYHNMHTIGDGREGLGEIKNPIFFALVARLFWDILGPHIISPTYALQTQNQMTVMRSKGGDRLKYRWNDFASSWHMSGLHPMQPRNLEQLRKRYGQALRTTKPLVEGSKDTIEFMQPLTAEERKTQTTLDTFFGRRAFAASRQEECKQERDEDGNAIEDLGEITEESAAAENKAVVAAEAEAEAEAKGDASAVETTDVAALVPPPHVIGEMLVTRIYWSKKIGDGIRRYAVKHMNLLESCLRTVRTHIIAKLDASTSKKFDLVRDGEAILGFLGELEADAEDKQLRNSFDSWDHLGTFLAENAPTAPPPGERKNTDGSSAGGGSGGVPTTRDSVIDRIAGALWNPESRLLPPDVRKPPERLYHPEFAPFDMVPLKHAVWYLHADPSLSSEYLSAHTYGNHRTTVQHYTVELPRREEFKGERIDPALFPKDLLVEQRAMLKYMTIVIDSFWDFPVQTVTLQSLYDRK